MTPTLGRRAFARLLGGLVLAPAAIAGNVRHLPLAPALPVRRTNDPTALAFLDAIVADRTVPVFYQGGSTPGALRRFTPTSIHRLRPGGPIYARGHCHLRDAPRTLRLDRVRMA